MGRKSNIDIRKPEILEHFCQIMDKEGFEGASFAKIANHMGVHPSLLIHYFKTKEEMVAELVDFIVNKFEDAFLFNIRTIADPQERFDKFINTIFGFEWERHVSYRVYFGCLYLAISNERIKASFRRMFERFRELIIDEITLYQDCGIVEVDDSGRLADVIISLHEGMVLLHHIQDNCESSIELADYAKNIAISLLKGK